MSSTNRSEARDTHIADYYVTPIDKIINFIDAFVKVEEDFEGKILDPCSGGDENHPMSYPEALKRCGYTNIDTIDIREDSLANIKGNYLEMDCKDKYNIIITNPPFNLAREIIEKALDDVQEDGFVIMLVRLNFFGGKLRRDMWENHMPKYSFVYNKRLSFTDDNKTDSIEYQHLIWQKGHYPDFTQLRVID